MVLGLVSGQYRKEELRSLDVVVDPYGPENTPFYLVGIQVPGLDGILGYDFFQSHLVCLDLPARQARISRN